MKSKFNKSIKITKSNFETDSTPFGFIKKLSNY